MAKTGRPQGKQTDRISPCRACNGRGWTNVRNPKNGLTTSRICGSCGGNGYIRTRG